MSKTTRFPDGMAEQTPEWHFDRMVEFTRYKLQVNEPSPHLRIVGHMAKDHPMNDKLWLLSCYGATYCLPSGQVIWEHWSHSDARKKPKAFAGWISDNWKGIITRTERRCVRTPSKMAECLLSCADWIDNEFEKLPKIQATDAHDYYNKVYDSVMGIRYFGRYISIRFVEGLRRFCDIPAMLYDVRSVGGWSPKRCLMYLYPDYMDTLRVDDAEGNATTDALVEDLLEAVKAEVPAVDSYVLAAMLCEYKGAFENRHQYVGWTLDQEPLLYDKTIAYWKDDMDTEMLWKARKDIFPWQVLGEIDKRWWGTRWDLTNVLRDHHYVWTDLQYDYNKTKDSSDFAHPIGRVM
jgi:hypothetical protein